MITSSIYGTRPFMVSRKIEIITGTCFPSHKDYMHTIIYYDKNFICLEPSHQATLWWKLQWITATELVDLWSLKEKKQYKWTDKGYRRSCTQNHRGWGYMLFTGCLSSVFSKRNNIFSCVNVRKKLSHVAVTHSCFEALVVVCCLLMKFLAVFWHC